MNAPAHLLFLPGAGADPAFWQPVGDRLPAHWQKTHFGWPGLGDQPPHPDVTSFDDLVAMVEKKLGDSPVDLLAQSMGGLIAMRIVLAHPARVRRLVLSVTSAGIDTAQFGAANWQQSYYRDHPNAAPWVSHVRADLTAELPRVMQPTLLLWGDNDPISPAGVGEHLRRLLPNARLHIVKGGGHNIAQTHAAELAPLIEAHLKRRK